MKEAFRQLIHLSGVAFIILAQFLEGLAAPAMFFLLALTFLIYSLYLRHERNRFERFLRAFEKQVRKVVEKVERPGIPMRGAFWFYFSMGLVFLLFPRDVATTAGLILAVSDSLSTLVGCKFGSRQLLPGKSLEGTAAFFASAWLIAWILQPLGILAAVAATVAELLPGLPGLQGLREKGLVDDNLLIPIFVSLALLI